MSENVEQYSASINQLISPNTVPFYFTHFAANNGASFLYVCVLLLSCLKKTETQNTKQSLFPVSGPSMVSLILVFTLGSVTFFCNGL